ncbi:GNAT family N-acetyltransferase [Arthrobacter bambusae]|uniref:N-acetyltransferase n=1 Tax=Arthrobacter TaxID=1663 RepID=UPI001F50CC51|nr:MULTISPECIES: N-acetyltransferase [Arthrobacter]MCI0142512.1 GNAT family N-acetyltransferase [Arthrobacter bambusae]
MAGESDLTTLLRSMHPVIREGDYVYALWPHGRPLEGNIEAAVREAEGLTVVLRREEAGRLGLSYDFVAAWITLQIHSALEAVGLTAAVSSALTAAGISCNVLAGFHHDHLLVPSTERRHAMEVLELLGQGVVLRTERPADRESVLALTAAAFSTSAVTGLPVEGVPAEVKLLTELFDSDEYLQEFSIVAEMGGEIVGHVICTRGRVGELRLLGLGPISVQPHLQRRGIGSALLRETARRAEEAGELGIALLGSTEYYPRFGFLPARKLGVSAPGAGWGDHFQLLPLKAWPDGASGTFRYAAPFQAL